MNLNDQWFKDKGFNVDSEPYKLGRVTVYKNYIRDGSGRYEGYLAEKPVTARVDTVDDLMGFTLGVRS